MLLVCLGGQSIQAALGLSVGFWSSLGSLYVLQLTVQRFFVPTGGSQSRKAKRSIVGLAAAKYAFVAAVIYLSLRIGHASAAALAVGIGLPQAVIFLKAIGLALGPAPDLRGRG